MTTKIPRTSRKVSNTPVPIAEDGQKEDWLNRLGRWVGAQVSLHRKGILITTTVVALVTFTAAVLLALNPEWTLAHSVSDYVYLTLVNVLAFVSLSLLWTGIFPIIYVCYQAFQEPERLERLKDDFRMLGLSRSRDVDGYVKKLFHQTYGPRHYAGFLVMVALACSLAGLLYLALPGLRPLWLRQQELTAMPIASVGGIHSLYQIVAHLASEFEVRMVLTAFLGAYLYSLMEVVRRYNVFDLTPQTFSSILVRMAVAVVFAYLLCLVWPAVKPTIDWAGNTYTGVSGAIANSLASATERPGSGPTAPTASTTPSAATAVPTAEATQVPAIAASEVTMTTLTTNKGSLPYRGADGLEDWDSSDRTQATLLLVAFFIGFFPTQWLNWLRKTLVRFFGWLGGGAADSDLIGSKPLGILDGMNTFHESRLNQMGIDNVQNLAFIDIRKILLSTQYDSQVLVNWIDQAMLAVIVRNSEVFYALRENGISTYSRFVLSLQSISALAPDAVVVAGNPAADAVGMTYPEYLQAMSDPLTLPNYTNVQQFYRYKARVSGSYAEEGLRYILGQGVELLDAALAIDDDESIDEGDLAELIEEFSAAQQMTQGSYVSEDQWESLGILAQKLARIARMSKDIDRRKDEGEKLKIALGAYNSALELRPDKARLWLRRASLHNATGNYEDAIVDCTTALNLQPGYAMAYHHRGNAETKLGSNEDALSDFSKALEIDDTLAVSREARGLVYNRTGQPQLAAIDLECAWRAGIRSSVLFGGWSFALVGAGQFEQAVDVASRAITLNPRDPAGYAARGLANYKLNNLVLSQKDLGRAIAAASVAPFDTTYNSLSPWHNRGQQYLDLGEPERALADFDAAIERAGKHNLLPAEERAKVHRSRAEAHLALARKDHAYFAKARQDLEDAIALSADDRIERARLHWALSVVEEEAGNVGAQGKKTTAEKVVAHLEKVTPDCVEFYEKAQKKLVNYRQLVRILPDDPPPPPPAPPPSTPVAPAAHAVGLNGAGHAASDGAGESSSGEDASGEDASGEDASSGDASGGDASGEDASSEEASSEDSSGEDAYSETVAEAAASDGAEA